MQYIMRPASAPDVLMSEEARRSRRAMQSYMNMDREKRSQTSVPQVGMDPNNRLLVEALAQMTSGKCAFCEAKDRLTAHRFRPAGNALPLAERKDAHLFYVWLADAWHNLFPICPGCRPAEPLFPVDGARCNLPQPRQIERYVARGDGIWSTQAPDETNLLIDPSRETSYHGHLKPKLDGTLVAQSPRAAITIETFNLNREQRREERAKIYRANIERLRKLIAGRPRTKAQPGKLDGFDELFDFGALEFGGTWMLLLKRLAERIDMPDGAIGTRLKQLKSGFRRLASAPDAAARLDRAVSQISLEDPRLMPVNPGARRTHRVQAQLRSVEIENFKAVERLTLTLPHTEDNPVEATGADQLLTEEKHVRPTPSLVVLGENATGKSSLLEAIALALTTEEARRNLDLDWSALRLEPEQMGVEEKRPALDARVRLEFDSGQTATLTIAGEEAQVRTEFGSERVAVFAYGAFRRFSEEPVAATSSRYIRNLFDASPLANPEPWLRSLKPTQFEMVVRTLRGLLSIEGDFEVIQRAGRSRQLRMVTALTQPDGTLRFSPTPLHAVSSGYRSMLGMLCDILKGLLEGEGEDDFFSFETSRGVVLIDEIEAHLHPRWKVQVMTSLRKALPGMTFIVTTHDPLCLRGMGSGEVVVLQRVAASDAGVESSLPIVVEQMTDLPDAADLRLEQLLTSDFFQLFSTNDAASDRHMARIGDLIRQRAEKGELTDEERRVLDDFERDIASALPVGSSEIHRIVQKAVAEYLEKRREASSATLKKLSEKAKDDILAALEAL